MAAQELAGHQQEPLAGTIAQPVRYVIRQIHGIANNIKPKPRVGSMT